jgi:hypothetical protein
VGVFVYLAPLSHALLILVALPLQRQPGRSDVGPAPHQERVVFSYKTMRRGVHRLRALFSPKVLIATILGAVVLATLLGFSDIRRVWQLIAGFPR